MVSTPDMSRHVYVRWRIKSRTCIMWTSHVTHVGHDNVSVWSERVMSHTWTSHVSRHATVLFHGWRKFRGWQVAHRRSAAQLTLKTFIWCSIWHKTCIMRIPFLPTYLSLSLSPSLSLYLSICTALFLCVCLCLSLPPTRCLCLYLSLSFFLTVCVSPSCVSVPLWVSLHLFLQCLSVALSPSLTFSLYCSCRREQKYFADPRFLQ